MKIAEINLKLGHFLVAGFSQFISISAVTMLWAMVMAISFVVPIGGGEVCNIVFIAMLVIFSALVTFIISTFTKKFSREDVPGFVIALFIVSIIPAYFILSTPGKGIATIAMESIIYVLIQAVLYGIVLRALLPSHRIDKPQA